MEENNRAENNEERNIFYEYFCNLEKEREIPETPSLKDLNRAYKDFCNINNEILKTVESSLQDFIKNNDYTFRNMQKVRTAYLYVEKNYISTYKQMACGCFFCFRNFFNQYVPTKQNYVGIVIEMIDNIIGITNQKLNFVIGGVKCLCHISNIIEWIYTIINGFLNNNNENVLLSLGCKKLGLSHKDFIKILKTDISKCISALKQKNICRTIYEDIFPLIKQFNLRKVSTSIQPYKEFVKYFIIADCAYTKATKFKNHPKEQLLSQEGWHSPNVKYRIDNNHFHFNQMVNGIVVDNYTDEIAIGFGGTEICNRPLTILIDLSQTANISPGYIYAVGLVTHINNKTPNKNIVVCGHSLGGGLAQFATATQKAKVRAYCYNSAGLFNESYKIANAHHNQSCIKHYRLEWDWVSCLGKLIGSVYTAKSTCLICFNHGRNALKKSLGVI